MSDATKLAEAREALHDLLRGQHVRELQDQNGERVAYSRMNVSELQAYIRELERSCSTAALGTSGPLRPLF